MNGCRIRIMAGALTVLFLGCTQHDSPLGVDGGDPGERAIQAELSCTVALQAGTFQCNTVSASLPAGVSGAIIGGQGVYVLLESSNVRYVDAGGTGIFSAEVTVRNFLTQTLGAIDDNGTIRVDPDGIRVFFLNGNQIVDGTGTVDLAEDTPQGTFTGVDQYYFQYDQALSPGQRSLPREWVWLISGEVNAFTFTVAVSGRVLDEAAVEPGLKFAAGTISAGGSHSCGLTLTGAAYCWGNGSAGRLGTGSDDQASTPQPVSGGLEFAVLTTGRNFSCGLTRAGAAYCWGDDDDGQLGDGAPLADSFTPAAVSGGLVFHTLSSGVAHTCGLTTSGAAYCWGKSGLGRLGSFPALLNPAASAPVAVEGSLTFSAISAGGQHTCALTTAGQAYCWGNAGFGQLGNGFSNGDSTQTQPVPAPVHDPADGPVTYAAISAGGAHTCALTTAGAAYCWGWNSAGQAGNDSGLYTMEPAAVADPDDGPVTYVAISAGGTHTCALTTAGAAYCWGWNFYGQLGNGDEVEKKAQAKPVPVLGNLRFVSISAGELHTCGVTGSGVVYCWGNGGVDRLGNGIDAEDRFVPTPVATITNFALLDDVTPAASLATGPGASARPAGWTPRRTTFEAFACARSGGTAWRGQAGGSVDYYGAGEYRAEG